MADVTLETLAQEIAELRARVAALEAPARPQPAAVVAPPAAPPVDAWDAAKATVTALFAVAVNAAALSDDEAFLAFRDLVHADRRGTPLLDEELRSYKWRPLLSRYRQYLAKPEDPTSFAIERSQPESVTPQTEQLKLYLRAEKRMPPPLTLRRDAQAGGAWRLEASSL
jgi:hypothetical protein